MAWKDMNPSIARFSIAAACLTLLWMLVHVASAGLTSSVVSPIRSDHYTIKIDPQKIVRTLGDEFFGFNIDWINFQDSLWDASNKKVNPDAIRWLKPFRGAIYRFPGGTESNHFVWRHSVGPFSDRPPQKLVAWHEPVVAEFGPREFLIFTNDVGGRPWYVLNLYGLLSQERPVSELGQEIAGLAQYMRDCRGEGLPGIFRWELGNELDRRPFLWDPNKYIKAANSAMTAVMISDKNARFVSISQDWDASKAKYGLKATDYNAQLAQVLGSRTSEFANHLYYDGRPWGPAIPAQLHQLSKNCDALSRGLKRKPSVWVTEHGRTPTGTSDADPIPKKNWRQTADLGAAISVADMVIALSQMPVVNGAFLHSLHATNGPWPLFHKLPGGELVPSAVYWSLRILRETMADEVLAIAVESGNKSGYEGGYDLRASAMADTRRDRYVIWLTNRANQVINVNLSCPQFAGISADADRTLLTGNSPSINNYIGVRTRPRSDRIRMNFSQQGVTTLQVPPNAVMTISLEGVNIF